MNENTFYVVNCERLKTFILLGMLPSVGMVRDIFLKARHEQSGPLYLNLGRCVVSCLVSISKGDLWCQKTGALLFDYRTGFLIYYCYG